MLLAAAFCLLVSLLPLDDVLTVFAIDDAGAGEEPVVLFTHIPLARPESAACGPRREKGRIRAGVGFGYQNTLGAELSDYLIAKTKPIAIFR
jgi:hypothetical protein